MKLLRRIDAGVARGEATIAGAILGAMIVVAAMQAALRGLATSAKLGWAIDLLARFEWADNFLQKGTLWVAFLGASLATYSGRHLAMDVVTQLVRPRLRALLSGIAGAASAITSFLLSIVFWNTVMNAALERSMEYEVIREAGAVHVCDATPRELARLAARVPSVFCMLRSLLRHLGAPVETPEAAARLIVPVVFLLIACRLLFYTIGAWSASGDDASAVRQKHAFP